MLQPQDDGWYANFGLLNNLDSKTLHYTLLCDHVNMMSYFRPYLNTRKKSPSWALPQGNKDSTFFVLYKEVMSHKFIHVPCLKLDKIVIGPQRFHLLCTI